MSYFYSVSRAGFARLQLIFGVVVALIFVAVVVAEGVSYLKLHGTAHAVENAQTLNTLLAQYATDNDGVYPVGEGTRAEGKSEGIALDLLLNNYTPNADVFAVGATARYAGTAKDYADLAPENMSWDFTAGATATTGVKADTADALLPVFYTTGETVNYAAAGKGFDLAISGRGPFGTKGVVVAYKNGSAVFLPAEGSNSGTVTGFISPQYHDTGTYTQIRP